MMTGVRKTFDSNFKAKVALEAIKNEKTLSQLSSDFGVHTNQIIQWKKKLLEEVHGIFSNKLQQKEKNNEQLISELYRQIGQLKVELDWLKKKSDLLNYR